jgi:hypothetical protein
VLEEEEGDAIVGPPGGEDRFAEIRRGRHGKPLDVLTAPRSEHLIKQTEDSWSRAVAYAQQDGFARFARFAGCSRFDGFAWFSRRNRFDVFGEAGSAEFDGSPDENLENQRNPANRVNRSNPEHRANLANPANRHESRLNLGQS